MPLYEYRCANCQASFEALRSMSESNTPIACPHCASHSTFRQISTFAAISKGNGGSSRLIANSQSGSSCASCQGGSCATCGH